MATVTQISQTEFDGRAPVLRVIVHEHPRRWGKVQLPGAADALVLSWRSDRVDPMVSVDPHTTTLWIGVDQRLVGIGSEGNTLFAIGLDSVFLLIRHFEQYSVVLCEDQVIAINHDHSLRRMVHLREIPQDVDVRDGQCVVRFIDGSVDEVAI